MPFKMPTQLLERVPFLAGLSEDDLRWLADRLRRRKYARGDIIFQKDEPGHALFIIESGSVRIYIPGTQGADLTLAVMGAGDFFGDLSLLDGRPRSASATAASDSVLLSLERSDFTSLLRSRPDAALAVLATIARRLRETDQTASDLAFLDVPGRLARKLIDLAEAGGIQREDGVALPPGLTQEELANMIGVTRESVNRNLSAFRRRGLIAREGRRIVIRNATGLRSYCE
jgi:CRP/FNR family transcriptional regulator/CRP/FNR family cyclic AMP-dependent transcriptional regulator